jgi:hypothetical protein
MVLRAVALGKACCSKGLLKECNEAKFTLLEKGPSVLRKRN